MNIESVLKSHGLGGRYGSGDRLPPPPVTNLKQLSTNGRVELTWDNPVDTDFAGLIIVRSQDGFPRDRFDGVQIFDGIAASYMDEGLTNYQDYFYRIFTYDYDQNYNDHLSQRIKGRPEETYVYGFTIDLSNPNPDTSVKYTHDAEYFSPGATSWQDTWLFRGIRPVLLNTNGQVVVELDKNDFSKDVNGNPVVLFGGHNVMIEFPKFYTAVKREHDLVHVTVSRKKLDAREYNATGFFRNTEQIIRTSEDSRVTEYYVPEADAFYLAAYPSTYYNNTLGSWSWSYNKVAELSNIVHNLRFLRAQGLARNIGNGYGLMHFQQYQVIALLYLFWFKSLDSQSKLGAGIGLTVPGSLNQKGMLTTSVGDSPNKLFGMEGFWSGFNNNTVGSTWLDGLLSRGNNPISPHEYLVQTGIHIDDPTYVMRAPEGQEFSGFVSSMMADKSSTFFLPRFTEGSGTTYYSDYVYWRLQKNTNTWDYDVLNTRRASLGYSGGGNMSSQDLLGIFSVNLYQFDYIEALDDNITYPSSRLCFVPAYKQSDYTITRTFIGGGQYEWTLNTF